AIAIRVDGPAAWDLRLTVGVAFDDGETWRLELRNGSETGGDINNGSADCTSIPNQGISNTYNWVLQCRSVTHIGHLEDRLPMTIPKTMYEKNA
ncbi:MAG: alkyl sulfatase C-terminal domain-containing protein, partial [Flammeovirgaceae bacterium]